MQDSGTAIMNAAAQVRQLLIEQAAQRIGAGDLRRSTFNWCRSTRFSASRDTSPRIAPLLRLEILNAQNHRSTESHQSRRVNRVFQQPARRSRASYQRGTL